MNLVLDFGNTRIKWAIFDADVLVATGKFSDDPDANYLEAINLFPVQNAMYLSTRGIPADFLNSWKQSVQLKELNHSVQLPICIEYSTPMTLGMDRIAAAVAAKLYLPNTPLLVIDMGTCITADYIDQEGRFMGGNISPGIQMRLDAMHTFTAKLPKVEALYCANLFGDSTKEAMQNGGVKGALFELEALFYKASESISGLKMVLTGGDAHYFEMFTNYKIFAAPNLVLEGVNEILQYNAKKI